MWNWKLLHKDKEMLCYCDIDSINNPEEDENGFYASIECYKSIPVKIAAWMSFYFKNKEAIKQYVEYRQGAGLPVEGYQDFNNTLCLVEIDSGKGMYRLTPTMDYNSEGRELGQSAVLEDAGRGLFKKGLKDDWSPIEQKGTHKAIHALVKFVYG